MASTGAPGISWSEQAGLPATLQPNNSDVFGMVGTARRGPTNKAPLVTSWDDYARKYGGIYNAEHLPVAVRGFFTEGGQKLLVSRVLDTDAKAGSARLLDCDGYATLLVAQKNLGSWGGNVSVTTQKFSTTVSSAIPKNDATNGTTVAFTAATKTLTRLAGSFSTDGFAIGMKITISGTASNNGIFTLVTVGSTTATVAETIVDEGANGSTVINPTGIKCADVTGFEVGDVFRCSDGTDTAVGVICVVDSASGRIEFPALAPVITAPVATGSTIATSSKHRAQTTTTQALVSSQTSLSLTSVQNIAIGSILVVQSNAASPTIAVTVTGVAGNTVSFASVGSLTGTYASGSKVSSCEFLLRVKDGTVQAEDDRVLSVSDTLDAHYVSDALGASVTFSDGSVLTTSAADLTSNLTSLALTSAAGVAAGDWIKIGTSYVQVKSKASNTVSFDSVGVITTVSSGANVLAVTPTYTDDDANKSDFLLVDEHSILGPNSSANTNGVHRMIPKPVSDVALTGGSDGTAVTGVAKIIGASTPGAKTGVYLFEDADEFDDLDSFAIPGLDDTEAKRILIDASAATWASTNGKAFVTSVPSGTSKPQDAKSYKLNTLALDSSYVAVQFPWFKVPDPNNPSLIINTPSDGWQLGIYSRRGASRGVHVPPANEPFQQVLGLTAKVTKVEHELLNDAGLNVIKKDKRGIRCMGARTTYTNLGDGTLRHFVNVRRWLNFVRRTLEQGLPGLLFEPSNAEIFDQIKYPVKNFLFDQFKAGAFGPVDPRDAFDVKADKETTRPSDLSAGTIYCHLYLAPAGAVEKIKFVAYGFNDSVRVREL